MRRQACPVFPGSGNSLHWGLEDPAEVEGSDEEKLAAFRRTRQELTLRLRPFIEIARRTAGLPVGERHRRVTVSQATRWPRPAKSPCPRR